MTDDIEIRQAVAADCDAILAMLVQLARELGDSDSFQCRLEDIREHGFGANSLFCCLIAARQQENLGLALFFPVFYLLYPTINKPPLATRVAVVVEPVITIAVFTFLS